jgi:predicted PurR-regulated permease PerM
MTDIRAASGLPRGVLILVGFAATVVVVAGIRSVADIVGPVFLALVLTISAIPIRGMLMRRGVPRWAGTSAAILAVYVGVVLLAASLVVAGARFADLVPQYQDELVRLLGGARRMLADLGVSGEQISAVLNSFDLGNLAGFVASLIGSVLGLLTNLAFILTLVLFMCLDSGPFGAQLRGARAHHAGIVEAMESFVKGTRKYFIVSTVFGLIVAVIDTAVLWIIGVPGAALWGLLAFITNYIPNVGFVLGLIPPAVLGLLEGGPSLLLVVVIAYSVINFVIQSIIQPKLVGDAVGMSASVTFLSLVIWAWILGPLGALLAIPLSLLAKAVFIDVDAQTRWVSGLVGDKRLQSQPAGVAVDGGSSANVPR